MRNAVYHSAALSLLLIGASATASAANWDEATDGDLSTDPNAPTAISFDVGSNIISGNVQSPDDTRDYITFELAAGQQLDAIILLAYDDIATGGDGNRGFYAINAGATSFIPGGGTADDFLGGDHLDPDIGTDLLPALAAGTLAGSGFDLPLGEGVYSFLVQQTGPQLTGYSLEFVVSAVPVPAALPLLLGAIGALGAFSRRR